MTAARTVAVRGLTVVAAVAFLGVLGGHLTRPGYTHTRLVFFAALGALAVAGAAGVVFDRQLVAVGGACGLLLLGFWQAVLWVYVFPVAGLIAVAAVVTANRRGANASGTEQ